ncbi:unnamed protein product [Linum trigynum]|uniref:Uncharacterized protein n=1 Tax=Linum trigynum TaxID=586398 RepID=A0AAV2DZ66_9ROSI
MSRLSDVVVRLYINVQMEQEEKYTEAIVAGVETLQSKLQTEMASRIQFDLQHYVNFLYSSPFLIWNSGYLFLLY